MPILLGIILILSYNLRLRPPYDLFLTGFLARILYTFLSPLMSATCPPQPFLLDWTAPIRKHHYICNFGDVAILTKSGFFSVFQ
jgi:hypothetical protein